MRRPSTSYATKVFRMCRSRASRLGRSPWRVGTAMRGRSLRNCSNGDRCSTGPEVRDPNAVVRCDAHKTQVEERVELLRQQQAVLEMVAARAEVRLDVCSIEDGLGVLPGDGAPIAVGVKQARTKRPLPLADDRLGHAARACIDLEKLETWLELCLDFPVQRVVGDSGQEQLRPIRIHLGLPLDDVRSPSLGRAARKPSIAGPESCVPKNRTAHRARRALRIQQVEPASTSQSAGGTPPRTGPRCANRRAARPHRGRGSRSVRRTRTRRPRCVGS